MAWRVKQFWVVNAILKDEDEEGEPLNWGSPSEEYLCKTYEEAQEKKRMLLAGEDEYYGNYIEDVYISDDIEDREVWVSDEEAQLIDIKNADNSWLISTLDDEVQKLAGKSNDEWAVLTSGSYYTALKHEIFRRMRSE